MIDPAPESPCRGSIKSQRLYGTASRLRATARPVYLMSILVIERRGLAGLTATQIADYAAMRTYTDADPAKVAKSGLSTILTVLDAPMGSETPRSMTAWDLSFLRGLYRSPAYLHSNEQRGSIVGYIRREREKTGNPN